MKNKTDTKMLKEIHSKILIMDRRLELIAKLLIIPRVSRVLEELKKDNKK